MEDIRCKDCNNFDEDHGELSKCCIHVGVGPCDVICDDFSLSLDAK